MTSAGDIFRHESVQSYLRELFATKATRNGGVRALARRAGFRSSATLSMIAHGQRRLTSDSAEKLARALKLTGNRRRYLDALGRLDRAKDAAGRLEAREALLQLRQRSGEAPLALAQYRCLSTWYYPALYELVGTRNFRRDPAYLARRLGNGVTAAQVETALKELVETGLLREEDGKLVATERALATSDGVRNAAIQKYHREMLSRAAAALSLPVEEREVSGLTVKLSRRHVPRIKQRLKELRTELNEALSAADDADDVYQLSLLFFPLTQSDSEESSK